MDAHRKVVYANCLPHMGTLWSHQRILWSQRPSMNRHHETSPLPAHTTTKCQILLTTVAYSTYKYGIVLRHVKKVMDFDY
jgi:hypothetical protein